MSKVTDLLKTSLDALNDWDSDRAASYILRDAMTYLHRAVSVLASEREPSEGDAAFIAGARTATETSVDMVTARLCRILRIERNRTGASPPTLGEMLDRLERWVETAPPGAGAAALQVESARHRLRSMIGTTSETMTLDALLDWIGERLAFAVAERKAHADQAASDAQTIAKERAEKVAAERERDGLRLDVASLRGQLRAVTADLAKARDDLDAQAATSIDLRAQLRAVEAERDEARHANHSATIASLQAALAKARATIKQFEVTRGSYLLSNNTLWRKLEAAEGTARALRAEIDASKAGTSATRRFVVGDEVCDDSASPTLMRVTRTWNKGAILACEYTSGGTRLTRVVRADLVRPLTPDESAVES